MEQRLEEMPAPSAGFFGGLPYWLRVISARWKRSALIAALNREQQVEQRKVDEILRDLGKLARSFGPAVPALVQPLAELRGLEGEREKTESTNAELTARLSEAKALFEQSSSECQQRIDEAQGEAQRLQAALKERQDELRGVRQQLGEVERQLKLAIGQRDRRQAEAAKAKSPEQREDLEQAAAEIAVTVGDREQERERARAEASALETPIAELTGTLNDARGRLASAQRDLAAARQALAQRERELGVEARKVSSELAQREQTVSDKLLEIGKILDSSRVAGRELEELYGRGDDLRRGIERRGARAAELEQERESYDRRAVKNGKIVVLSGLGLLVLVTLTLIIVFAVIRD